jgi:hypothetical protein
MESEPLDPAPVDSEPNPPPVESTNTQAIFPQAPVESASPPQFPAQPSSALIIAGLPITVGNTIITPTPISGPSSLFIIASQTLSPGGSAVTVNGVTISLPATGSAVLISPFGPSPPQEITLAGQTITANSESEFVIGTQTLSPGGSAITLGGTPVSLASGATEVIVGGTTTPVGSIIMSVFNGGPDMTETSSAGQHATPVEPAAFTGVAAVMWRGSVAELSVLVGLVSVMVVLL